MKIVAAIVMGFLASALTCLVAGPLPLAVRVWALLACWSASAYLLQRGAKTASQVLGRGFLLGAAEWLLLLIAAVGYPLLAAPDASMGVAVKGFIMAVMACICLAGFAAVQLWQRVKSPSMTKPL